MSQPDYRLLIDSEVVEQLQAMPKRQRELLFQRFREMAASPNHFCDFVEQDRVGRDLGNHVFRKHAITFWQDGADGHLKILGLRSADKAS